jgi:hypothetical protein
MKAAAAVAVLILAVAGCSASSSTASQPPSAASVARHLGATGIEKVSPPTLYAYDEVTATLHGRDVDIATFRNNGLRDKWVQAAGQFTGIETKGDRYAVADA